MKRMIVYIWMIKGVVFLLFLLSIVYLLGKKYVEEGECVSMLYYLPLSFKEYCAMAILACSALGLSYLLTKSHLNKWGLIIEVLVYVIIVAILFVCGNDILASVQVNWLHTYPPKQYKL